MRQSFILVINCGSSSLKFAVVDPRLGSTQLEGIAENLNGQQPTISWKNNQTKQEQSLPDASYPTALQTIAKLLKELADIKIVGVGHRVVHGGEAFKASTIIGPDVMATIKECVPLAPLHNPANLAGIEAAQAMFPEVPHVAVFDTAFHQTMPHYAYIYPLPYEFYQQYGVRRYGFHGTSHQYVTQQAAEMLGLEYQKSAFISAHLGNGCSAAAVLNGHSIDTSMGLTPLEGLVMGTRCGDIDPSLPQFLVKQLGVSIDEVTKILNRKSGLLGISGVSFDMRTLVDASEAGNHQAQLAIEIFCYRLAKYIGALAITLGRIDALIFTGGIGENSPIIREKVLSRLALLNFTVEKQANAENGCNNKGIITQVDSSTAIVVKTDEQLAIAREVQRMTN